MKEENWGNFIKREEVSCRKTVKISIIHGKSWLVLVKQPFLFCIHTFNHQRRFSLSNAFISVSRGKGGGTEIETRSPERNFLRLDSSLLFPWVVCPQGGQGKKREKAKETHSSRVKRERGRNISLSLRFGRFKPDLQNKSDQIN